MYVNKEVVKYEVEKTESAKVENNNNLAVNSIWYALMPVNGRLKVKKVVVEQIDEAAKFFIVRPAPKGEYVRLYTFDDIGKIIFDDYNDADKKIASLPPKGSKIKVMFYDKPWIGEVTRYELVRLINSNELVAYLDNEILVLVRNFDTDLLQVWKRSAKRINTNVKSDIG